MKKPVSKLSILFIFAILIPGSVLTFFSVQNIASMKELKEKRLLENQSRLASELARDFQEMLIEYSDSFFRQFHTLSTQQYQNMMVLDSLEYVHQPFVVNRSGHFVWPNFTEQIASAEVRRTSSTFWQGFSIAESAEFAESDLRKAADAYRDALRTSVSDFEGATAINGLARVLAKRGMVEQAFRQYRTLVRQYGSTIDESGLPFAQYALHQLIRLSNRRSPEHVIRDMGHILSRFADGRIPLTLQTESLLGSVINWCEKMDSVMMNKSGLLRTTERIQKNLKFVLQHRDEVKALFRKNESTSSTSIGSFIAISGTYQEQPYLLVMDTPISPQASCVLLTIR